MRVLLVEPQYRRGDPKKRGAKGKKDDETLWYPPIALLKLATFHRQRGDDVFFAQGMNPPDIDSPRRFVFKPAWDRVYISTLFTFHFDKMVETINFYKKLLGGTTDRLFVGGVMATLMRDRIQRATGVVPFCGMLRTPADIGLAGDDDIDLMPLAYDLLDPEQYAVNETLYAYTTRGCTRRCPWCGVPLLEPEYRSYVDIRPMVLAMRETQGDPAYLRLMDNNILASDDLPRIVSDLLELGYGRGEMTTKGPRKVRVVDFNQGVDARYFTEERVELLAKLNIKPLRIAFDGIGEKSAYIKAVRMAVKYDFASFSNYMLYNFKDPPRDLYDRLRVNIELNQEILEADPDKEKAGAIFSYPMRFAPIFDDPPHADSGKRDRFLPAPQNTDWRRAPAWTPKFVRAVEVMKGAANGAISPTPTLALRTIGESFDDFVANLYMPEELLRNRNKHEKKVYADEPKRRQGTGYVEGFRDFVLGLLEEQREDFHLFHEAVTDNRMASIRAGIDATSSKEIKRWLRWYLKR